MQTNIDKARLEFLIGELVNNRLSQEEEKEVCFEIDLLSLDPLWSDYIYWSNEYLLDDGSVDIQSLVNKITKSRGK